MGDEIRVTVIATRYSDEPVEKIEAVETPKTRTQPNPEEHIRKQALMIDEQPEIRREELRRLDRKEREERLKKLNSKVYDIHDPESLTGLETVPAYMRKRVLLDPEKPNQPQLSRLSVEEDSQSKYKLRDNNSFLHDNVD